MLTQQEIQQKAVQIVNELGRYAFKEDFIELDFKKLKKEKIRELIFEKIFEIRNLINKKYPNGKDDTNYRMEFPLTSEYELKKEAYNKIDSISYKLPGYGNYGFVYKIENSKIYLGDIKINTGSVDSKSKRFKKIEKGSYKDSYRYTYINELDHCFTYWLYKVLNPSKRMPSNLEAGLNLCLLDSKNVGDY